MKPPPRNPRKAPPDRDALRLLYIEKGLTYEQIGEQLGRSSSNVVFWLQKLDLWNLLAPEARRKRNGHRMGLRGDRHPGWKGGTFVSVKGYRMVLFPDHPNAQHLGYVLEHRKVMSDILGRPLTEDEVVHHKDGDKLNNSPDNLELMASGSDHMKTHHRRTYKLQGAGLKSMQQFYLRRSAAWAATRLGLETYARKHNVSLWYLRKVLPRSARSLLKKDIQQGLTESPILSYYERAGIPPVLPISRWREIAQYANRSE